MNIIRFTVLFVLILSGFNNRVMAGFYIKKSVSSFDSTMLSTKKISNNNFIEREVLKSATSIEKDIEEKPATEPKRKNGWQGQLAFVCGILGLFTIFLAIPAVILGIKGNKKGKKHRRLALVGLVLGISTLALYALLFMLYNWWAIYFTFYILFV